MPPTIRKFMLCTGECLPADELPAHPASHIIGELRHLIDEGRKITALAVYERSVDVEEVPDALPLIRVELIGDARRIRCTRCMRRERWETGKAAIEALVARVLRTRKQPGPVETSVA